MHRHLVSETDPAKKVEIADHLHGLLTLTNQWVGHHGGYLIGQPDSYGAVSRSH